MISLDVDLPKELLPLAWINGSWRGFGYRYEEGKQKDPVLIEIQCLCEEKDIQQSAFMTVKTSVFSANMEQSKEVKNEMLGEAGYKQLVKDKLLHTETSYWNLGEDVVPRQPKTRACKMSAISANSMGFATCYNGLLDGAIIQLASEGYTAQKETADFAANKQTFALVKGELMYMFEVLDEEAKALKPVISAQLSKVE